MFDQTVWRKQLVSGVTTTMVSASTTRSDRDPWPPCHCAELGIGAREGSDCSRRALGCASCAGGSTTTPARRTAGLQRNCSRSASICSWASCRWSRRSLLRRAGQRAADGAYADGGIVITPILTKQVRRRGRACRCDITSPTMRPFATVGRPSSNTPRGGLLCRRSPGCHRRSR